MCSRWDRSLHLSSFYAAASLCAPKHTCAPRTYAHYHPFTLPFPCRGERGGRSGVREGADNSELRTRQPRLLAEVLHLINGSRLHRALNHAQIKKLVIFKIADGSRRDDPHPPTTTGPVSSLPGLAFPSTPPPPPQWRCSSASLGFTSIIYSAFPHYLLLLFHLSQTPLSYQLSSQSHILISTHITFTSSP